MAFILCRVVLFALETCLVLTGNAPPEWFVDGNSVFVFITDRSYFSLCLQYMMPLFLYGSQANAV